MESFFYFTKMRYKSALQVHMKLRKCFDHSNINYNKIFTNERKNKYINEEVTCCTGDLNKAVRRLC